MKTYLRTAHSTLALLLFAGIALEPVCGIAAESRSVAVDAAGQLHIGLDSGQQVLPPKMRDQTGFGSPAIAPDHHTVGWLAMYPDPAVTYYQGAQIAGALVIYRDGRVLHTFAVEQVIWDWQFRDGGRRVAYSTGPEHGGAAFCVLRDVASGRVAARWRIQAGGHPPDWTQGLRY